MDVAWQALRIITPKGMPRTGPIYQKNQIPVSFFVLVGYADWCWCLRRCGCASNRRDQINALVVYTANLIEIENSEQGIQKAELTVVSACVDVDGQALGRIETRTRRVQSQFPDWDSHP